MSSKFKKIAKDITSLTINDIKETFKEEQEGREVEVVE